MSRGSILLNIEADKVSYIDEEGIERLIPEPPVYVKVSDERTDEAMIPAPKKRGRPPKQKIENK